MFFVFFAVGVKGMGRKESFGFEMVARTFVAYIYYINNIILSVVFILQHAVEGPGGPRVT
jgi:hypothetical protein